MARMDSFDQMATLSDEIRNKTSLEQSMIRSTKVKSSSYREKMEYWELWDEKEEFMKRSSRIGKRGAENWGH